jgi:type VI protein secretion system component VasK
MIVVTLIWELIKPIVAYIVLALLIIVGVVAWHYKAEHDGIVYEKARIEQEKKDAITKADAARNRVKELCKGNPLQCSPSDFRD